MATAWQVAPAAKNTYTRRPGASRLIPSDSFMVTPPAVKARAAARLRHRYTGGSPRGAVWLSRWCSSDSSSRGGRTLHGPRIFYEEPSSVGWVGRKAAPPEQL